MFVCRTCRQTVQKVCGQPSAARVLWPARVSVIAGRTNCEQRRNVHNTRQQPLQCQSLRTRLLLQNETSCDVLRYSGARFTTSSSVQGSAAENAQKYQRPMAQTTIDEEEVNKFSALAELWWDEAGEFEALHSMNELRVPLIRDALVTQRELEQSEGSVRPSLPLEGFQILDVGSGGGILSEPLARLGAFVIGVDASEENIKIAQAHVMHDPKVARNIKYIQATVEDLVGTEAEKFDAVVASEVVEHVADVSTFVTACCQLVKPGGSIFLTTLNKTYLSYALGVVGAENFLRLVSPGTHDWNKFISPQDLQYILDQNDFSTRLLHGMMYNPLTKRWSWIKNTSVNYAIHAVKATRTPSAS